MKKFWKILIVIALIAIVVVVIILKQNNAKSDAPKRKGQVIMIELKD